MRFTEIRDLKYVTADNSLIDLLVTCKEYGEIPITLNLVDTEDIHIFVDKKGKEYLLEEYCKTQKISPYIEPKLLLIVPNSITMRQARLYLLNIDLLDAVEEIIAQNRKWQIEWEYAIEVKRDSFIVEAIQNSFNLTDEQIDSMFVEANKI
ncbi:hypothetical protein AFAEC_0604 [Aliarcobacter faecis]|uniref:hypothetical protein n=1 Tax=Aliarcobacter faecis TaxID=1564138 RepID=UPI00047A9E36|nr:hypothetical protein [Aliarcobacter faecis]QKF72795.1 hypothetical protein AFAEC_0604 [Aliarcobacter faecis]